MQSGTYRRPVFGTVVRRLSEKRRFIQVLSGPRQVGKTTLALQTIEALNVPRHFAQADDPAGQDLEWLRAQWQQARGLAPMAPEGALLVLDEIQKIPKWSDLVKLLWDEDSFQGVPLKVLLLGSAPLLVHRGLSDSLAGRFDLIRAPHWSFGEMREAFGWDLDRYIVYGGYPGAVPLVDDPDRWRQYILDSLIETSISRDVLLLTRVDKPALLRQVFRLACDYSGQVLTYRKMLGQLEDAGNATTVAHYLDLLSGAGMVTGLQKYSGAKVMQRASSPKLVVLNTALMTAISGKAFDQAKAEPDYWGRLVESAVGAHLVNMSWGTDTEVLYWRDGNHEVDYILREKGAVTGLEVKSGRRRGSLSGLTALAKAHPTVRPLVVGAQGIPVEEFLLRSPGDWLR